MSSKFKPQLCKTLIAFCKCFCVYGTFSTIGRRFITASSRGRTYRRHSIGGLSRHENGQSRAKKVSLKTTDGGNQIAPSLLSKPQSIKNSKWAKSFAATNTTANSQITISCFDIPSINLAYCFGICYYHVLVKSNNDNGQSNYRTKV